jgi:cystathionine beta-lyase
MAKEPKNRSTLKPATRIATAARRYAEHGAVNPAVYRASTITYPDTETLHTRNQDYTYGRKGTPTSRAFETRLRNLKAGTIARPPRQASRRSRQPCSPSSRPVTIC